MRLTVNPYESNGDVSQPELPYTALIRNLVVGAIRWLFELTEVTETDQIEAGIFLGGEGRDR